jgi:Lrp/AsnC family leucine-responsive transcriptional regulator
MSASYIVIEFTDPDKLIPAVEQLEACEAVESWDAVEGHANLVLRLACAANDLPDAVRKLDGLKQVTAFEIVEGEDLPATPELLPIRAYLFIDTEPEQKEAVRTAILALPETLSCIRVKGECDLVVLVKGETLSLLKDAVSRKIRPLDGVLRLKSHYAFNIKQL